MKLKTIEWDGKRITKPGMYSKVPFDTYHHPDICGNAEGAEPSISSSGLRALNPDVGSPADFYAYWPGNPKHFERPETRSMIMGRAAHHLFLGEKFFSKLYAVQPEDFPDRDTGELKKWNGNRLECREWIRQQKGLGRTVVLSSEAKTIVSMDKTLHRHPLAKEFLRGIVERSFFWKDKKTGIWLKWRPDNVPTDSADCSDLKTTISTDWFDLQRTIRDYAYYQQAALGKWAFEEIMGTKMESYTFLFGQTKPPFNWRDVRVSPADMRRGERMNRVCLDLFAECLKKNSWPGPGHGDEGRETIGLAEPAQEYIDKLLDRMEGKDGKTQTA